MSPEAAALSLIGVVAGALAVFALLALFKALSESADPADGRIAFAAACLVVASPLFWMTAVRPLSDVAGLAVALAVQALVLAQPTSGRLMLASVCAGLGAGIRSQVIWLTIPVLLFGVVRQRRWPTAVAAAAGYIGGVLAWAIPLVLSSGGPASYFRALANQGAEDFTGVVMLWTTPTVRQLVRAFENTFVAPWSFLPSAAAVLLFAAAGIVVLLWRAPRVVALLALAFGPYLIFHMLFQETATTRYALPLVVPVAYAAVRGIALLPGVVWTAAASGFIALNIATNVQANYWYARVESPAFQMLRDMRSSSRATAPVLAMHRRDEFDLRRPIVWSGLPAVERRLPSPPKHEWLEVVKYWNEGGRQPVWFVADPPRSDLALFRRQRPPTRYRWSFNLPMVMGGMRPNEMDWHIIEPPDWYLGQGWALTPETAGVGREDKREPRLGGIDGWIRRWPGEATLMIGGRNLTGPPARLVATVNGQTVDDVQVPPGFFLRMVTLPAGTLSGDGDYAPVRVVAPDPVDVAVEQFDAQPVGRLLFGYGDGWNELEYNPSTGRLWRWTTEKATLRVRGASRALALRMDGEIEEASSTRITIRAGDRIIAEQEVGRTFSFAAALPADLFTGPESSITIETSAWYIPAEARRRSPDRRHLGLKIYSLQMVPAS